MSQTTYRVLARKYRPTQFGELIGQHALVQTLTNAFKSGRLAHAFVLTGVRGVGKTTTARIIAKTLNCQNLDLTSSEYLKPCETCENCQAISLDRHVDVLEIDAATHTGVDDVREIIDGVRYAPVMGQYKVYIIDEVHMLSKAAFNALLKTLEEPPDRVKFIFATTEIRKVPITILSRCQRFDLKRIDAGLLQDYFKKIVALENATIEEEALRLISEAADGSARDGLSLLDQAIALGAGQVKTAQILEMLGRADRTRLVGLYEAILKADISQTLSIFETLYQNGAEPMALFQDLLEMTHALTRSIFLKSGVEMADEFSPNLREKLTMPVLTRIWQILLKGLSELAQAPQLDQAAEMLLMRLIHAMGLPQPVELIDEIRKNGAAANTPASKTHPVIEQVMSHFPQSTIKAIHAVK